MLIRVEKKLMIICGSFMIIRVENPDVLQMGYN